MPRPVLVLIFTFFFAVSNFAFGWGNDGPPIAITSPDEATTYVHADVKNHTLIWNKKNKELTACITFTDARQNDGQPQEDTFYFHFPGVVFDQAKGVFNATAPNGEVIPVARIKKTLFLESIDVTPNANVRIMYPRGEIMVILEAISPNDPSMHAKPPRDPDSNPDSTHSVDLKNLLN